MWDMFSDPEERSRNPQYIRWWWNYKLEDDLGLIVLGLEEKAGQQVLPQIQKTSQELVVLVQDYRYGLSPRIEDLVFHISTLEWFYISFLPKSLFRVISRRLINWT